MVKKVRAPCTPRLTYNFSRPLLCSSFSAASAILALVRAFRAVRSLDFFTHHLQVGACMVAQAHVLLCCCCCSSCVSSYLTLTFFQVSTGGGKAVAAASPLSLSGASAGTPVSHSPLVASVAEGVTPRSEVRLAHYSAVAAVWPQLLGSSPQAPDFSPNTVASSVSASPVTRSAVSKQVHTRTLPPSGPHYGAPWKRCSAGGFCLNHCGGATVPRPPLGSKSSSTESTPRAFTPRGGHVVAKYHDRAPAYSPLGNPSPTSSTPTARR